MVLQVMSTSKGPTRHFTTFVSAFTNVTLRIVNSLAENTGTPADAAALELAADSVGVVDCAFDCCAVVVLEMLLLLECCSLLVAETLLQLAVSLIGLFSGDAAALVTLLSAWYAV